MRDDTVSRAAFLAAVSDRSAAVPAGLVGPDGAPDALRFQVYRNTVASTLTEALAASFPAFVRLVGDAFFAAAAIDYSAREKPASPLLFRYGASFPDHLAGIGSLAAYPYVPDVARLDWAWLQAYHAADAAPFGADDLAAVPHDALAGLRLSPHPAMRTVISDYPVVSIWAANRADETEAAALPDQSEDALVTRPDIEVLVHRLPPGGAALAEALASGRSLEEAAGHAASIGGFDLGESLSVLLRAGAFAKPTP